MRFYFAGKYRAIPYFKWVLYILFLLSLILVSFNSSLIGSAAFWCPVLVSFLPSTLSSSLLFFLLSFPLFFFPCFHLWIQDENEEVLEMEVLTKIFFNFAHVLTERISYKCLNFQLNYTFISKQKSTELHNHL